MAEQELEWERMEYPLKCGARVERIRVIVKDEDNIILTKEPKKQNEDALLEDDYWQHDPDEPKRDYYEYDFDDYGD